ncbi:MULTISPECIES: hypothetical protein [Mycolicibacterium]|uniref:Uncharacterized protein n=1 Tax=Mycolicibacterium mucogenicum TaxID=56689 RepID=A0A4R5WF60_MYCMU|nr:MULTISPECIES: hypothetical protein [Mycolicibacterium]MCX8553634.1 hypothetical protein [Mycolicibacterium mucogenicum]TDK88344.1 hypothetical protein EUA03_15980 [Mycolicibacterium mucogenicum]BCI80970.1 hypothetical protein MTY66_25950 [Mycolicibacterium sp. TY66]BCJ81371.1 hypothetical protein MTY81_27440 [Mycolicibacterium sp. TY81]
MIPAFGRPADTVTTVKRSKAQPCRWCGREVADAGMGRRRQYCRQSCRQRAYEQRAMVKGTNLAEDSVVLSAEEAAALSDRVYQVRCAAEDVATAVAEGAGPTELKELCEVLLQAAKDADGWR